MQITKILTLKKAVDLNRLPIISLARMINDISIVVTNKNNNCCCCCCGGSPYRW